MNLAMFASRALSGLMLAACGDTARLTLADGVVPQATAGTRVAAFAGDLDHPRCLMVLPIGDVLVASAGVAWPARFSNGMFIGPHGLLVADDVGNLVWRVTAAP